jgi:ABC-2 type transport system ATP-binding protein
MPSPAIRTDGLAKYYGPVIGIEDVSLQVERGEVFGFLGANGAGKTTTIRILLDLLRPSKGTASVFGFDCRRQSLQSRRQMGYLPGELTVYPDLSAAGYLTYLSRLDDRHVDGDYLSALLRRFDISDVDLRRSLRDQSHGMKQKIGIVQALMTRPAVVILDEPTAGLDPFMVHAFREIVEDLRKSGTTVFLSSHVLTEVEATCDRVGIIRAGRIVNISSIDDLKTSAPRRVVVRFASAVPPPTSIEGITVVSICPDRWELDAVGRLEHLVKKLAPLPVSDISVEPFRLEELVLAHYGAPALPERRTR